jgi:hypothetical protein
MILINNFFQAILFFQKKIQTTLFSKIFPVIVIFFKKKKKNSPNITRPLFIDFVERMIDD